MVLLEISEEGKIIHGEEYREEEEDVNTQTDNSSNISNNMMMNTTKTTRTTTTAAQNLLSKVPPRIGTVQRSELLDRVAAFLPKLATSNREILTKSEEEVNIEMLKGDEKEIIEMRLGLGVWEERQTGNTLESKGGKIKFTDRHSYSNSNSNSNTVPLQESIAVLPSELQAKREEERNSNAVDPFEKIVQSLLTFNESSDEEVQIEEFGGNYSDAEDHQESFLEF